MRTRARPPSKPGSASSMSRGQQRNWASRRHYRTLSLVPCLTCRPLPASGTKRRRPRCSLAGRWRSFSRRRCRAKSRRPSSTCSLTRFDAGSAKRDTSVPLAAACRGARRKIGGCRLRSYPDAGRRRYAWTNACRSSPAACSAASSVEWAAGREDSPSASGWASFNPRRFHSAFGRRRLPAATSSRARCTECRCASG